MADTLAAVLAGAARRKLRERRPEITDRERLKGYAKDPVGFARDVLQTIFWRGQADIANAVRDNKRAAVCSGQKIGKTTCFAALALWFYVLGCRVFMTAPTEQQLENALWREVKRLRARATIPIPGDLHLSSRGGLHDRETLAHITGLLGRDAESLQGMSGGSKLVFMVDEASGVEERLLEAIKGNLVGGGRLLMAGNPTRVTGEFFDAFKSKRSSYKTLEISSLDVPEDAWKILGFQHPDECGLARREDCEKYRIELGEDSPFYQVRVLGKFVVGQEGRAISIDLIERAHSAWRDNDVPDAGTLVIGLDVAGESADGDASAFAPMRGNRILEIRKMRGLSVDAHCVHLEGLFEKWGRPGDKWVVVLDGEGIGHSVARALRDHFKSRVHVIAFLGHLPAVRKPLVYKTRRDELPAAIAARMRLDELELPPSVELDQELNVFRHDADMSGKLKLLDKRTMRKELGRSPDAADAVMLAAWWLPTLKSDTGAQVTQPADIWEQETPGGSVYDGGIDPYGGS